MNNALIKIQAIAKKLRKSNPKLSYQDAIKKASIEYKKMGAVPKKKKVERLPVKKIVTTVTKEKIGNKYDRIKPFDVQYIQSMCVDISLYIENLEIEKKQFTKLNDINIRQAKINKAKLVRNQYYKIIEILATRPYLML